MLHNKTNLEKKKMKNVYINSENNSLEKINHKNGSAFNEIRIIICLK